MLWHAKHIAPSMNHTESRPTLPIAVVIPAYNRARLVASALESVLAQTRAPAEIIVVDDGSTDDTAAVAQSFGATVLRQSNAGVSAARNAGVRIARSPWIAFLDSDDLWAANKLEVQWEALEARPETGMVFSDFSYFDDATGETMGTTKLRSEAHYADVVRQRIGSASFSCEPNSFGRALVQGLFTLVQTMIVRRDLLLSLGIFDTGLRSAEDWELFLRLAVATTASVVEMPLVSVRRMHSQRLTKDIAASYRAYADVATRIEKHPGRYPVGAVEVFRSRLPVWLAQAGSLRFRSGDFREAARDYRDALRYRVTPGVVTGAMASFALALLPVDCALRAMLAVRRSYARQQHLADDGSSMRLAKTSSSSGTMETFVEPGDWMRNVAP
jgi:glycosyltransferase involved in cell wall biosynthesis